MSALRGIYCFPIYQRIFDFMRRTLEMDLEYLPYLSKPPVQPEKLHQQSVSNDDTTIKFWRDTWVKNMAANYKTHGPFNEQHIGMELYKFRNQPAIVLGSGPSLKNSIEALKKNVGPHRIPVVSCLHNFHYLMDNDIQVDLWVTLDAGAVTLEEISEGGQKKPEEYLEMTNDQSLAAFVASDPKLIESWQGYVMWYSAGIPDKGIRDEMEKIEKFQIYLSTGGNVLGAAMYIAKGYWGCNPIAYSGADFCFDYTKKFHPWDSKYDGKLGNAVILNDIFGNKVYSWQSYINYKSWFEGVSMRVPGQWFNASEGGALGAYPQGLMPTIQQISMWDFIRQYKISEEKEFMARNPTDATEPNFNVPKVLF
ncbi:DUF115 domain-containing protein [bacterium]|nr:DUF115 domain-containing protein [bacterium]